MSNTNIIIIILIIILILAGIGIGLYFFFRERRKNQESNEKQNSNGNQNSNEKQNSNGNQNSNINGNENSNINGNQNSNINGLGNFEQLPLILNQKFSRSYYIGGPDINNGPIEVYRGEEYNIPIEKFERTTDIINEAGRIILRNKGDYLCFAKIYYYFSKTQINENNNENENGNGTNEEDILDKTPRGELKYVQLTNLDEKTNNNLGINVFYGGNTIENTNREDVVMDIFSLNTVDNSLLLKLNNITMNDRNKKMNNPKKGSIFVEKGNQWIVNIPDTFKYFRYQSKYLEDVINKSERKIIDLENVDKNNKISDSLNIQNTGIYLIFVKTNIKWKNVENVNIPFERFRNNGYLSSIELVQNSNIIPGTGYKKLYNGEIFENGNEDNSRGPMTLSVLVSAQKNNNINLYELNCSNLGDNAQMILKNIMVIGVQISNEKYPIDHFFGVLEREKQNPLIINSNDNMNIPIDKTLLNRNISIDELDINNTTIKFSQSGKYAFGLTIYYAINNIFRVKINGDQNNPTVNFNILVRNRNNGSSVASSLSRALPAEYKINVNGNSTLTQFGQIQQSSIIQIDDNQTVTFSISNNSPESSNNTIYITSATLWLYHLTPN